MSRGLLLTMTEPPPAMEEEFNAWYDDEHLAERLAIPGFLSAQRWVADVGRGEGKYLGTYELQSPAVLQSAEYLARFRNQTPWSRRCLGRAVVFRRWACEQLHPGTAPHNRAARALYLAIGDQRPPIDPVPGALSLRLFFDPHGQPRYVAMLELADERPPRLPTWQGEWSLRLYRAYTRAS